MKKTQPKTKAPNTLELVGYAAQLASVVKKQPELMADEFIDRAIWGAEADIRDALLRAKKLQQAEKQLIGRSNGL